VVQLPGVCRRESRSLSKKRVAPALDGATIEEPADAGRRIDKLFGIQAIQAGEEGLLASVTAALD